ncbi:hypothetical protein N2152v2_002252 [Parachlorella kessleri]
MAVNATPEEEAIIKKRYLTQTAATQANALPPFKKLTKRYLEFCQVAESGTSEEAERLYGELLADLYAVQFHMQKLEEISNAFRREQQMYQEGQEQLQASITQAVQDIEDRKQQLEQARTELQQKKEYEVVKRQIVEVPARSVTRAEMEAVNQEIRDMQAQAQQIDTLSDRRKRQFAALASCIEEVYATIEAEAPPEEGEAGEALSPGGVETTPAAAQQQQQQQRGRQEPSPMQIG